MEWEFIGFVQFRPWIFKVSERKIDKADSIKSYLLNNIDKLANYMERKEANLPYTSSIAETSRVSNKYWIQAKTKNVVDPRECT